MAKLNPKELSGDLKKAYDIIQKLKKTGNPAFVKKAEESEKKLIQKIEEAKAKANAKQTPKKVSKPVKAKAKAKRKTAKKVAKPRKKTTLTKVPFVTRAKQIKDKEGISWAEAKKKVQSQIKDEKKKMSKIANSELQKLINFVSSNDFQDELSAYKRGKKGRTGVYDIADLKKDAGIQALPRGKRKSKSGKTYYEYRDNRSDVRQDTYPYLEAGGTLPENFGQAGLVGETGTMNEVDLFAMGGDLPQGVHQYYGQTYNPAYPTPHGYAKGGEVAKEKYKKEIDEELDKIQKELVKSTKDHRAEAKEHSQQTAELSLIRASVKQLEKGGDVDGRYVVSVVDSYGDERATLYSTNDRDEASRKYYELREPFFYKADVNLVDTKTGQQLEYYDSAMDREERGYAKGGRVRYMLNGFEEDINYILDSTNAVEVARDGKLGDEEVVIYFETKDEKFAKGGKLFTADELLKKYKGKFIDTYPHYDYLTKETKYEVRSVKNKSAENHETPEEVVYGYAKGGKMKQGYNDRLDESLGNRDGVEPMMMQSYKDRRDESKGMEKAMGRRAYQSVGTMDKMAKGGKIKGYAVDVDTINDQYRDGLDFDTYDEALKVYNEIISKDTYNNGFIDEELENVQLIELYNDGEYSTLKSKFYDVDYAKGGITRSQREKMIKELVQIEGFKGNGFQGVQQMMKYANMNDEEVAKKYESAKGGSIPQSAKDEFYQLREDDMDFADQYGENDLQEWYEEQGRFAKGGKIGFDGLAKKVAKRYVGKPVPKKFQEEYGKTYSKAEAMEVGKKVAGKVYREQQGMAHGGMMKQGYNAQLDESLGVRKGREKSKKQSFKDRRDESKAMEKSLGRRAYSSVKGMDKGKRKLGHGGKIGYRE